MLKRLNFKLKDIIKNNFPILIIFIASLCLYFPVLTTYFSGDDFFHFKVSQTDGSLFGFIKLFGIYRFEERGIAFYRPIFREVLYNIFYSRFGLNHIPFRILQFIVHFINISLVFKVFGKIFKEKLVAILGSLFFAISAANVGVFYYLAGGIQAQGALMFTLLSMLSFLSNKKIISFIFFLLGLMSHELAISIPFLLLGIVFLKETSVKSFILGSRKKLWHYGLMSIIFLYVIIFVIGTSQSEIQYKINLNPKTLINTLSWYFFWGLGVPEMLVDYLGSGLKLNPDLLKNWNGYFKFIFPSFFALILFSAISLFNTFRKGNLLKDKRFWFLIFWFIVGLLPVAFLPIHKKTYYLQISLPAVSAIVAYLLSKSHKLTIALAVLAFLILNVSSVKLADKTYWAALRGRVAEKLINNFKQEHSNLPKGTAIYIKNDTNYPFFSKEWGGTSTQAYFALNGDDALQLLYNDNSLKVFYEDKDEKPENSLEFVAEIN